MPQTGCLDSRSPIPCGTSRAARSGFAGAGLLSLEAARRWDDGGVEFGQVLGALAHRGGVIVEHETLRVGVVQMVSWTSGLQINVLARRPADRRSTAERRATIRAGVGVAVASRRLLPSPDEGMDLRLGWLDALGVPHWTYPQSSQSDSGSADDGSGPTLRATYVLPPLFDSMTLLLAWPEIGSPETSLELDLPDAETVEQASVSIWDADLPTPPAPSWTRQVPAAINAGAPIAEETGAAIATPQLLHRSKHAALVLTWLSDYENVVQATVTSVARGTSADHLHRAPFPTTSSQDADIRASFGRATPTLGLVEDHVHVLITAVPGDRTTTGGPGIYEAVTTFTLPRLPANESLRLAVGWPQAGLDTVEVLLTRDIGHLQHWVIIYLTHPA